MRDLSCRREKDSIRVETSDKRHDIKSPKYELYPYKRNIYLLTFYCS